MSDDVPNFPTIRIGGITMFDMTSLVTPNRYVRASTDALVLHHSVTAQHYTDMSAELQHIRAIDRYHHSQGYGGFGYNAAVFESGRVYVVGDGSGARAHVAGLNGVLEGCVMIGDYSSAPVPLGITLGVARWLLAKFRQRGLLSVKPHREYNPFLPPYYRSVCPGDAAAWAIDTILAATVALSRFA